MYVFRKNKYQQKVYANKFQLESTKKTIYDKKDVENSSECFERMNMGLSEFYRNIRYETAISDLQLLSLNL